MQLSAKIYLLTTLLAGACNSAADEGVFNQKGNTQSKPLSQLVPGSSLSANSAPVTVVAHINYNVEARSVSNTKLCSGTVQMELKSNFTLEFPAATLKCVSLTLDLAGLLGSADLTKGLEDISNFNSDGKVLSLAKLAGASFTPPRPLLLGPIIQDASIFKGFSRSVPETMTYTDANGAAKTATGTFNLQVFEADTTYSNNYLPKGFDHVIHWALGATGFDGVGGRTGLVFKKFEWVWSIRPIMIPKLIIVGNLSDFITKDPSSASSADSFVGELTIELTATSYTQAG